MNSDDKDWGRFFKQLFDEGKKFSECLLKENERLRERCVILESELARKENMAKESSPEVLVQLAAAVQERDRLKEELQAIYDKLTSVERENVEFVDKYLEIEKQNSNFASLYVASYQLHSSLDLDTVMQRINEVVINLVGAERFSVYLFNSKTCTFSLVGGEGIEDRFGSKIPWGDNFLSDIARAGTLQVAPDIAVDDNGDSALAALPMIASNELVGVLVVHQLFVQKEGFDSIDMELFDLLGNHAATALVAAQLYTKTQRKASTLEGFLDLLKKSSSTAPKPKEG